MIYGKLSLESWHTAEVGGEVPQSSFESYNLRLFFYGVLYNRDILKADSDDTNAKLAADVFLSDPVYGFSRLDGSFTIVYYSENECGVVRDHHGTHYPVYCTMDGDFATSRCFLDKQLEEFYYNTLTLSEFLQRGFLKREACTTCDIYSLGAGHKFYMLTEAGYMLPIVASLKSKISVEFSPTFDLLKENLPAENAQEDVHCLKCDSVFVRDPKVVINKNPDIEAYSRRYGELHTQAIRRRIGDSCRVGILLSGGYDSGSNLAALRSIYDGQIDSYSVGFKEDTWTELPMARLMSDTFGTRHHEYEIDGTEINALPDIIRFLEEPFVEAGMMVNYCAMRMVGEDDKPEVILGGDGSDQYFGTSGREVALHYLATRAGLLPLMRSIDGFLGREIFNTGGKLSRIHFHLDKILHILEGERFGFSNSMVRSFLQNPKEDFKPEVSPKIDARSFEHLYTQHAMLSDEDIIDRIILFKASRMAQMFGNNLVFPFMDLELYHFLQELPISLKCQGDSVLDIARGRFTSKFLLKYHYKPLLPPAITSRKKQGGFAPMPLFFRDKAQRARFKEFILASNIFEDYLRRDVVEKFLMDYDREANKEGSWFWYRQNKALQYFNLLTLLTWWEVVLEEKEVKF